MADRKTSITKRLLYFTEACAVYSLAYGFLCVPFRTASAIGGAIARTIGPRLAVSRIAQRNLEHVMPECSEQEKKEIIKSMWDNLGRTVAEFSHVSRMDKTKFDQFVRVEGQDIIDQVIAQNKGALFISGHFANWEVAPKMMAVAGSPVHLVYRSANNPHMEKFILKSRANYQVTGIEKGKQGAKKLIQQVKAKQHIGILLDQRMSDGIEVPLLNQPAMTAPAAANLARRFNVPLVPVQITRHHNYHFTVTIHSPLKVQKTDNQKQDIYDITLQINQHIGNWIKSDPGQWLWLHHRWGKWRK